MSDFGPNVRRVTIVAVEENGNSLARDTLGREFSVRWDLWRTPFVPVVGELWIIDRSLGPWTYAARFGGEIDLVTKEYVDAEVDAAREYTDTETSWRTLVDGDLDLRLDSLETTPPAWWRYAIVNKTTSWTLALTAVPTLYQANSGSALTVTVPPNSTIPFAIGVAVDVVQEGVGQVTFAPGAGVTINSVGTKTRARYSSATLIKVATNTWYLIGDVL